MEVFRARAGVSSRTGVLLCFYCISCFLDVIFYTEAFDIYMSSMTNWCTLLMSISWMEGFAMYIISLRKR